MKGDNRAVMRTQAAAALLFVGAVAAGSLTDHGRGGAPPVAPTVLAGDFHVHGMPGDGALPVWEIQREAVRRGLDVIAITNHNDNRSFRLARATGQLQPYPIVIPGQELTTGGFHMAAIGVRTIVDPYLPAHEAIARIHAQGGVAIAAHPVSRSWTENDSEALRTLDGSEMAHPLLLTDPELEGELFEFRHRAQRLNPDIAPIGSTDFHVGSPLGLFRTYLIVDEVSEAGVLEAIRRGRTVASGPGDRLVGAAEHIAAVRAHLGPARAANFHTVAAWPAIAALFALSIIVLADTRS